MNRLNEKNFTSNNHSVTMLTDHMVFCPKYRGKVLAGEVGVYAEKVIRGVCRDMGIFIIRMAVNPDHIHIFYKYPPEYSVCYIAKKIKGISSRRLRQKFPHLKQWCGEHLWAPSCFHGSVGHGWDVVDTYIQNQAEYRTVPAQA